MKKRVLVATGQDIINSAVRKFEDYEVVGIATSRDELEAKCAQYNPDILLVGEALFGSESLVKILLDIARKYPNIRIVYLAGHINLRNEQRVNSLALLVMAGVYDIVYERKMTVHMLKMALDTPKTEKDVKFIIEASSRSLSREKESSEIEFIIPEEYKEDDENIRNNLFVISSIKPGTGKSFLSVNIATAIAQYGIDRPDGKRPRVGLIEADLQNLSLGTLLQIEDDDKNLKTVMNKISEIVTPSGEFVGDIKKTEEVNEYIKSCFIPYYRVKNLRALVGSQLTLKELEGITNYHYIYLVDAIVDEFDVLIVDSNSSLTHVTTFPLLHMAKNCYYVLNLDFNNVRNNIRYREVLREIGILDKVRYVLNEDISNDVKSESTGTAIEELMFTADHLEDSGFKLEARIPVIPKTVFLNRLYEGTPIVLDEKRETEHIKYELLKVANQIYPIKNFSEIEEKHNKTFKKKRGFLGWKIDYK